MPLYLHFGYHIVMYEKRVKPVLYYICAFVLIFALSLKYHVIDFDLWDRLIMGKCVFQTGHVCYNDIISYTNTHTWFDPEWLLSAFIYFIQEKFNILGLIFLKAIFLFLMIAGINFSIRNLSDNKVLSYNFGYFLILIFVMFQSGILFSTVRCQLLTFFLLALWVFLLEKIRQGNQKLLFLLPFIMLFWLNTHGACIAGLGIFFLFIIGEFLNKKPVKYLIITYVLTCLVFFVNPWGINYIKFIFDSSYLDRCWISEWQSTFAGKISYFSYYKFFLFLVWGIVISKIYRDKKTYNDLDKTKLIILFVLSVLSVKYIKHIWLFMTIISIYFYSDFYEIYNLLMGKIKNYLQIEDKSILLIKKIKEILFVFVVFVFSAFTIFKYSEKLTIDKQFFNIYPVETAQFIKINNLKGKILAPFHVGSFLAYKIYPSIKIHLDGRQEQVYDTDIFDEMMFFYTHIGENPSDVLKKYNIDMIIFEKDYPILNFEDEFKNYQKVFTENNFSLYLRKDIQKFNLVKPKINKKAYQKHLFETNINFK